MKKLLIILVLIEIFLLIKPANATSPLHTEGNRILDENGNEVFLTGVYKVDFTDTSTGWFPRQGATNYLDGWANFGGDGTGQGVRELCELLARDTDPSGWGSVKFNLIGIYIFADWWIEDAPVSWSIKRTPMEQADTDIGMRTAITRFCEIANEYGIYVRISVLGPQHEDVGRPGCPEHWTRIPYVEEFWSCHDGSIFPTPADYVKFYTEGGTITYGSGSDVYNNHPGETFTYPGLIKHLVVDRGLPNVLFEPYDEPVVEGPLSQRWTNTVNQILAYLRSVSDQHCLHYHVGYATGPGFFVDDPQYKLTDPEGLWPPKNVIYGGEAYREATRSWWLPYDYDGVKNLLIQQGYYDYGQTVPLCSFSGGVYTSLNDVEYFTNVLKVLNEWEQSYFGVFWMRTDLEGIALNQPHNITNPHMTPPNACGQALIDATAVRTANITLEYLVNITGTVTNSETGSPIQGARVSCNFYSGTTDSSGTYFIRMTTPAPGSCDLTASRTGYATKSTSFTFNNNMTYTGRNFALDPVSLNSLYGRLIDINNNPVQASIIAYQQGTIVDSINTDSSGNYNLLIAPGTYDIQFNLINFYIPNYYIKIPSVDITADVYDLIEHITGYPTDNKVSIVMDIDESQTIQTYSHTKPSSIRQNGTNLTEVYSLLELGDNKWFYEDSINKKLHLVATPSIAAPVCGDGNLDPGEECEVGIQCPTDYTCINCRCVSTIISKLHTEGAHLVNEQGEQVHLHGVCKNDFIEDPWGLMGGEAGVIQNLDAIQSWGGNFIALGVLTEDYLANFGGVRDNLKRTVQLAYERGIYVGIGVFGSRSGEWASAAGTYFINNPQSYIDFWLAVSNDFKNTPNVLYNSLAEVAFGLDPGGTGQSVGDEAMMDAYYNVVKQGIQAIRNNGDENIFMYHEDYCGFPSRFNAPATEGGEMIRKPHEEFSNIVYDAHTYRWHGTFGSNPDTFVPPTVQPIAGENDDGVVNKEGIREGLEYWGYNKILEEYQVPILMWEGGANVNIWAPNTWEKELQHWRNLLEVFHELDISYAAFWWRPAWPWALINVDLSPNDWGQVLIDVLANVSPACECSAWVDQGCGLAGCSNDEQYQTRTCLPEGCGITSRCIYDVSCVDTCSDGTPYSECSSTKPLYCDNNGNLISYCSYCGCPSGKSCNETTNECYTIPGETFGKTDIGGSSYIPWIYWAKMASRFQAPENGNIIKINAYLNPLENGKTFYAAVYSDNAGQPDALLGTSDGITSATSPQWFEFDFSTPVSITANEYYWLTVLTGACNYYIYYDPGETNQTAYVEDSPPPADTFGSPSSEDWVMSIYATYT